LQDGEPGAEAGLGEEEGRDQEFGFGHINLELPGILQMETQGEDR
jgi:hypothetical protein